MEASHAGADAMVSLNSEVGPETSMVVPQPAAANCLNCDHQVTGKFCVNCAQRTDTHPMNWTWLMHEVQHGIFHVDRGILFTLKELFTRPGHAVRDYLEGKRKRYFPPFTLVMLLGALGILETNWLGVDSEGLDMEESIGSPELNREVFDAMMGHQTLFYLLMLPFMAFGTWLLFRKYGHGFVEHVVLNTFIAGQVAMISLVTWPLYRLGLSYNTLSALANIMIIGVSLWTLTQFFSPRPFWRVGLRGLSAFLIGLLTMMCVGGLTLLLVAAFFGSIDASGIHIDI